MNRRRPTPIYFGGSSPTVGVLASELAVGLSYTRVARVCRDNLHTEYGTKLVTARDASNRAASMIERLGLDHPGMDQMIALLERLKFEILALESAKMRPLVAPT